MLNAKRINSSAALLRICCALLVIVLVYLSVAHFSAGFLGAFHFNGDTAVADVVAPTSDQQHPKGVAPNRTCTTSGTCWTALPEAATIAVVINLDQQHEPVLSIDVHAKWDLTPPDRPPRRST